MLSNIKTAQKDRGFTIVELLIVIVIIAVLAAITIVAYNGITSRANATAAQSAANALVKKVEAFNAENGAYPQAAGCITSAAACSSPSVTTTSSSSWYSQQDTAFKTVTAAAASTSGVYSGLAAPTTPTNTKTVYYTNSSATGGCAWWYDYQNTVWKGTSIGSVTCPTLPTTSGTSLASIAI